MNEKFWITLNVFCCIIFAAISFCPSLHAEDKIKTVGGILQVQRQGDYAFGCKLTFRGKVIPNFENDIIEIKSTHRIGSNDVVLVYSNCSGSSCASGTGTFFTIKPDGTYKQSKDFGLQDGYVIKQVEGVIMIKYQDHLKYITITYDGGIIKEKKSKSPEAFGQVSDKDCRGVYELYTSACLELKQCSSYDFAHVDMGNYNYYSEDKRFKMKIFDDLCKKACKGTKSLPYPQFSKQVCGR